MIEYITIERIKVYEILKALNSSVFSFHLTGSTALGIEEADDIDFAVKDEPGVAGFLLSLGFQKMENMNRYLDQATTAVYRFTDFHRCQIDVCLCSDLDKKLRVPRFLFENSVVKRMYYRLSDDERSQFCRELMEE